MEIAQKPGQFIFFRAGNEVVSAFCCDQNYRQVGLEPAPFASRAELLYGTTPPALLDRTQYPHLVRAFSTHWCRAFPPAQQEVRI